MGPNGSGKSTLAHVLAGRPGYEITAGTRAATRDATCSRCAPEERARAGVFLGFQYPVEIPGVNNVYLLKAALNAARKQRGLPEVDAFEFLGLVREQDAAHAHRGQLPVARRERGLLRRREEAQRDPADAGARAAPGDPRRDRLRARHRCAQGGRRGGELAALARALLRAGHALPAAARVRGARLRARAGARAHRPKRRQRARARARAARLRLGDAARRPEAPHERALTARIAEDYAAAAGARRPTPAGARRRAAIEALHAAGLPEHAR